MHKQIRQPAPIEINADGAFFKRKNFSISVLLQPGCLSGGEQAKSHALFKISLTSNRAPWRYQASKTTGASS